MNIIISALQNTLASDEQGPEYFARPAGSSLSGVDCTNGLDVAKWLETLDWQDVTEEAAQMGSRFGQCRYFRALIPGDVVGFENVALLNELSEEELQDVKVVKGHHGQLELQLPGMRPHTTHLVHIIIGNTANFPVGEVTEEAAGVVTWYPGRLTPPVDLGNATVKGVL